MYNFPSALHADEDEEDTRGQVNKFTDIVIQISTKNHLLTILSDYTSKHPASNDWGDQSGSNGSMTGNDGADEQLKDSGYEVVPDDLETDGGTWRLIDKVQH